MLILYRAYVLAWVLAFFYSKLDLIEVQDAVLSKRHVYTMTDRNGIVPTTQLSVSIKVALKKVELQ